MSLEQIEDYIPVISTCNIKPGERFVMEIEGNGIILFCVGDEYYAINHICSHEYQFLDNAELEGYQITCPAHGAKFDIRNGNALSLPAVEKIQSFPVRVIDGMIEILI